MLRPATARRFHPELMFKPRSLVLVGGQTPLGQTIGGNLAGFRGPVRVTPVEGIGAGPVADLAVLACGPGEVAEALMALGRAGVFAAVCATPAADLAASAGAAGVRVLGPASFGLIVPGLGLNASTAHVPVRAGRVALVSQSAALCRAVLDWAGPNGVGFSHVVGTGGNAQTGFAMTLDWLSRDGGTGAILLDIRTIRDRRAFLAAARAAARLRPVVAIHAGGRLADPSGRGDAVFEAALRRVGVLLVTGLSELLGAAEVLTRARPPRTERLAIVSNAVGPAHLAADAAVALGVPLMELDAVAQTVLRLRLPEGPVDPGIVWTGADEPTRVAEAAAMVSGVAGVGGIVAILSPTGPADAAAVTALSAGQAGLRTPLLVCVLGETTGAGHRRVLADAGLPVFDTPEGAVRAFAQMVRQRRARAAAVELPPRRVLEVAPDRASVKAIFDRARADDRLVLDRPLEVLGAYGLYPAFIKAAPDCWLITVFNDPVFGPVIAFGRDQAAGGAPNFDLPPLNLPLARALVGDAKGAEELADALVRISQLVTDHPQIAELSVRVIPGATDQVNVYAALITLRPAGELAKFAIAAYPAELAERFEAKGETLLIRPIRPEDAEAHAALFRRLTPEDVRYRFFNMLRELPAEQVARMTQVDYDREMAFVAVREGTGETVGVCRLVRAPGTDGGEFAVVVEPGMKGRGLAARLMRKVMAWGRTKGMLDITGQVLAENAVMLAFMRRMGAVIHRLPDEPDVVEAVIAL